MMRQRKSLNLRLKMFKSRRPLARRERQQIALLFAAPLLVFALIFGRQMFWETPRFPVPPGTQILECRSSPLAAIGGSAYVQRVQSPLAPAQFWAQTKPLLEAKGMKPDDFNAGPNHNQAEVRNQLQQSFRKFGLSQTAPIIQGCAYSGGKIDDRNYNVYLWPQQNGTMIEFWIR